MKCRWCKKEYKLIDETKESKIYKCRCGATRTLITAGEYEKRDEEENK